MSELLKVAAGTAAALAGFYALSTRGRTGHPGLMDLQGWKFAHRGLHDGEKPENSMAAFRAALEGGYGIELDVHLLADGDLAVFHDSTLSRMTGEDLHIADLTTEDLPNHHLLGTQETIPTFRQVLDLFAGKAPMIIELKVDRENYAQLADAAVAMMAGYEGVYCMESFDPRAVHHLKKHHPQILRGQLTENYFRTEGCSLPGPLKWALKSQVLNFLTQPDFIAYNDRDRKCLSNALAVQLWGLQGVSWTLRTQADFDAATADGWLPIFEHFTP